MVQAVEVNGRLLTQARRITAVKQALAKKRRTLANSLAFVQAERIPRPADRARWAKLQAAITEFELILGKLERGEDVPLSPRTGSITGTLPDRLGEADREDKRPLGPGQPDREDQGWQASPEDQP
jgi:hypothetical protein